LALAGCDLLTISPDLLSSLSSSEGQLSPSLNPASALSSDISRVDASEKSFRFLLNEDAMATEKLSEGIRAFVADARKLDQLIAALR